ncbi:MAG: N-acetyltransferase [Pseudomonadota bacterium]
MIEVLPETPALHADAIEALYDRTFGPGHFAKTAERLREGTVSLPALSRVAVEDGKVIAACRIWPIEVGESQARVIFVGPVAVAPNFQGKRLGLTVTGEALEAATQAGWDAAVIIGAPRYFEELGFVVATQGTLMFPGPQDQTRIMVRDLAGKAALLNGAVRVPRCPQDDR